MDISFTVQMLSRFVQSPTTQHLTAAKHLLRYLKGTKDYRMVFKSSDDPINLNIYTDADWASDRSDRKSVTGMLVQLCGNSVAWSSHKQKTVSLSSTESEYMALSAACQKALWCKTWLDEVIGTGTPITIYSDNQSAAALTRSNSYHPRTKHIDVRHHFIKDLVRNNIIQLEYISTEDQLADILTKVMNKATLVSLRDRLLTH